MAKASFNIVNALRRVALKLQHSTEYQWGHMGACNCGFLAQEITHLKKNEIHNRAMQGHGDWNEQLNDYCPTSRLLIDDLITALIAFGFSLHDLKHLEKLSDPLVLDQFSPDQKYLQYNIKKDVILYLATWASILEDQLLKEVTLSDLNDTEVLLTSENPLNS